MRMRPAHDDAAKADDGDLGRAATDVDDEAARRLAHRQPGADRGGHRLLDEPRPAGARVERRVEDRPFLDLGDAGRDPDNHPGSRQQADPIMHLVDEVADHLLGHVEVADDPVAQRPDGDDVRRRAADHPLRLRPDRQDPLRARLDRDDRRLADDDAAVLDVNQGVGRAEVDPDVAGEEAEEAVEHAQGGGPRGSAWGCGPFTRELRARLGAGNGSIAAPLQAAGRGPERSKATPRSRSET